jgi:hypothetical protein
MTTISKSQMLASIVTSGEVPFRLRFVKATGKDAGQVSEKVCYYGAPNPAPKSETSITTAAQRKPRKSHLESNSLPLTEFGTQKMLTPHISHIISYNGKQVIH